MTDEPTCRLYLMSPPLLSEPAFELAKFAAELEQALAGGDAACLLLRGVAVPDDELAVAIATLAPVCHSHDVALIIEGRADVAANSDADGVHVDAADYQAARALMAADRIVGVSSRRSRHNAMEAAETAADFVAFSENLEDETAPSDMDGEIFSLVDMIRWWRDLIEVPCIALGVDGAGLSLADCSALAAAGADFVAVGEAVWAHEQGPAAGIVAANAAISVALEQST